MINQKLKTILKHGGLAVIPTDTIYGIVGSALNKETVERIYALRKRNPKKPMIVLIGSLHDIKKFGVSVNRAYQNLLMNLWPGKVSIILRITHKSALKRFSYLHRGTGTLAFRLPKKKSLRALLEATGPLVAPSANWEGHSPAKNIKEAKRYFGDSVFYVNGGVHIGEPSVLIDCSGKKPVILRLNKSFLRKNPHLFS